MVRRAGRLGRRARSALGEAEVVVIEALIGVHGSDIDSVDLSSRSTDHVLQLLLLLGSELLVSETVAQGFHDICT